MNEYDHHPKSHAFAGAVKAARKRLARDDEARRSAHKQTIISAGPITVINVALITLEAAFTAEDPHYRYEFVADAYAQLEQLRDSVLALVSQPKGPVI